MKTTIKINFLRSLVVEPSQCGGVLVSAYMGNVNLNCQTLNPEICAALTNAIQAALENKAAA